MRPIQNPTTWPSQSIWLQVERQKHPPTLALGRHSPHALPITLQVRLLSQAVEQPQPPSQQRVSCPAWAGSGGGPGAAQASHSDVLHSSTSRCSSRPFRCSPVFSPLPFLQGQWKTQAAFLLCSKAGCLAQAHEAEDELVPVLCLCTSCVTLHVKHATSFSSAAAELAEGLYLNRIKGFLPHLFPTYLQLFDLENNLAFKYF